MNNPRPGTPQNNIRPLFAESPVKSPTGSDKKIILITKKKKLMDNDAMS